MRFYYISIFSVMFLGVLYLLGTGLLVWIWYRLRKWKWAWMVMVPLFVLLYIGPIAEELWIAWNFGRLCSKDAGIFVYKTVQVEGFYDDTHGWRADKLRASGYQWVEGRGADSYWRHEQVGNEVRSSKIDRPTARYWYRWSDFNTPVGYKIFKQGELIVDQHSGEILGTSVMYGRKSPWFFIALDDPGMSCPRPGEDPMKKSGLLYKTILLPMAQG